MSASKSNIQHSASGIEPHIDYKAFFHGAEDRRVVFRANDPVYTFVDITDEHSAMTGVKREDMVGRGFFEVFPDVSEEYQQTGVSALQERFRKLIRTKQPFHIDVIRYDIPDGKGGFLERYWQPSHYPILDGDGSVAFILQTSRDVTDELKAKQDTDDLSQRLQNVLEIGGVGSWLWNVTEDKLIADAGFIRMFGMAEEQIGKPLPLKAFVDSIHPDDRGRVLEQVGKVTQGLGLFEEEYRTVDTDGQVRWVLARGQVTKADGDIIFPGVMVDVTERHNLQSEVELARQQDKLNRAAANSLQVRNKQLEEVARTKDEFVALASHQLRTPATAVKQYVGMVMQGYVGEISELQAEMLSKAFESNERQIHIVNQILNAARADTGRLVMTKQPVDIRNLCQTLADDIRGAIEDKGHSFTVRLPQQPIMLQADSSYLRMAIENLLQNASVYTPQGGAIELLLEKKDARQVRISVTDNGVGIKKSDQGKLFDKFSRIHNPLSVQAGGSGIGLYLAAEIIRLHDGKITVDSKLGTGTTFAISLPVGHNTNQTEGSN